MGSSRGWPEWNNPEIVLYHGTLKEHLQNIVANGVDTSVGRPNTDFGRGFYATTWLTQAEQWAETVGADEGKPHGILELRVDRLALRSLRSLAFIRGGQDAVDFWSFVAYCRNKYQRAPETHRYYDVVYGPVARTWFGIGNSEVLPDSDQISFHGAEAQKFLRSRSCKLEVRK